MPVASVSFRRPSGRKSTLIAAGAIAAAILLAPAAAAAAPTPFPIDLATAGVPEVQDGLSTGGFTSAQLTQRYLDRIDALSVNGPHLNSVRSINPNALADAAVLDAERAAGTVRGVMHGIPVLVKDNIDVAGMPTTAGSVALADSIPAADAPIVTAMRAAGAIIIGKTNLTEFANFTTDGMPSGYSSLGGQVLNPYDVSQTPSGSSSGSGSAGATGLATVTIGTETSGSILSPARANSLVGVKPTVGLSSRSGIIPISATQDTAGPMTRSVYDAAALLTATVSVDPEDPATTANPSVGVDFTAGLSDTSLVGTRLGVVLQDEPDSVYVTALAALEAQGATLVPVTVGNTSAGSILTLEFERDINAYLSRLPAGSPMQTLTDIIDFNDANAEAALKFGQTLLVESEAVDLTDPTTLAEYEATREQGLTETRAAIDSVLVDNDLAAIVSNSSTTGVGARAGYPSVVVPSGYLEANRRPAGLAFLGTAWSEQSLLSLAYDFEQATGAWQSPEVINPSLFRCTAVSEETVFDESCTDVGDAGPGTDPGGDPGTDPGTDPGADPGVDPGTPAPGAGTAGAVSGSGSGTSPTRSSDDLAVTGYQRDGGIVALGSALLAAGLAAIGVVTARRRFLAKSSRH